MPPRSVRATCGAKNGSLAVYDEVDEPPLGHRDLLCGRSLHGECLAHPGFELSCVSRHLGRSRGLSLCRAGPPLELGDAPARCLNLCDRLLDAAKGLSEPLAGLALGGLDLRGRHAKTLLCVIKTLLRVSKATF